MENKKIPSRVWVDAYFITFEYKTKRGNHKSQIRIVEQTNKDLAERDFWIWINTQNEDKPYRAMANVKILDIAKGNGRYITL